MRYQAKAPEQKTRTKCPFYGFAYALSAMMDTQGNQCALIRDAHSPCRRQVYENQEPNWKECDICAEEEKPNFLKSLEDNCVRVFPRELRPEGVREWAGVSFKDWHEHVVNGKEMPSDK